jgi:hypothetical protein
MHGLQRRIGIEHAAAPWTEHVPRHFEETELGSMQERADRLLFVEAVTPRKIKDIEAAEIAVRARKDADGAAASGCRLAQEIEQAFLRSHGNSTPKPSIKPTRRRC